MNFPEWLGLNSNLIKRLETIYENDGFEGVINYANNHQWQFGSRWLYCLGCETDTPRLPDSTKSCAVCGQVYYVEQNPAQRNNNPNQRLARLRLQS